MKTLNQICSLRTFGPLLLALGAMLLAPTAAWADRDRDRDRGEDRGMMERAGEAVSDGAITAQVKTRLLANTNLPGRDIEVETNDGTVTLSGTVRSDTEKDLAYHIAKDSRGVRNVRNNLRVRDDN
jgi:hyperosmotically inducible protein